MIPPPRPDLRVTPVGAGLAVDDPVTGGRARLGPESAAVWRACSLRRPVSPAPRDE